MSGIQRLVRFRGDRGRLNGDYRSSHMSSHIGMVRVDVFPSPSQIYVLPVQDRISADAGIWCNARTLWRIPPSRFSVKTLPPKVFRYRINESDLMRRAIVEFVTNIQQNPNQTSRHMFL